MDGFIGSISGMAVAIGTRIIGAIVLWIVGRWAIKTGAAVASRQMTNRKLDPTLVRYLSSSLVVFLNLLLLVAILGVFGIETTSFAAVFAAIGLAVGMAWSGLLANLAAGVAMIVLRPFKTGDLIEAGGVLGSVQEIGLFVTTVDTLDNVRTFIGNAKVFGGNIQNFSANPYRRVDLVAQLAHGADPRQAIALLQERLVTIPGVVSEPKPDVEILEFNLAGPVLAVRPYCNNADYWDVYFATNAAIQEGFSSAGLPTPEKHFRIIQRNSSRTLAQGSVTRPKTGGTPSWPPID